ncbi:UDP-3-O-[3-hydroxymyristoyl] N-acetylglucosamine deacetylase [Candidatus Marinamargulisbacteria bacterium SCGC AG-343-D04]|nr:UDP-3-O-[3-hydroxymyristoyl] N-acetylglucosamine deacetylase [Candidatus Marinamargulisbacteria bacterium SCGC AG-343-D04]
MTQHKTLTHPGSLSGIGIHSGNKVCLEFSPSKEEGITFKQKQNPQKKLTVSPKTSHSEHNRATCLKNSSMTISTPEHLLSACAGLGLTHLSITIDQEEIPILDGSAKPFIDLFTSLGITALPSTVAPIIIKEPIHLYEHDQAIIVTPSSAPIFSYFLHYPHPVINTQCISLEFTQSSYISSISEARTFGFEEEIQHLIKNGLAKGGSLDNALVIGDTDYINPPRFPDECARHKLLDLIGDCWILNRPIHGHITGIKSGHSLNNALVKHLTKILA